MNGPTHRKVGVVVGVAATVGFRLAERKPVRVAELVGAAMFGAIGASAPDLLEPATSSYHRGVGHSVAFTGVAMYGMMQNLGQLRRVLDAKADEFYARAAFSQNPVEKVLHFISALLVDFATGAITGFVPAYASHVLLDATTPRGIPLVGITHRF